MGGGQRGGERVLPGVDEQVEQLGPCLGALPQARAQLEGRDVLDELLEQRTGRATAASRPRRGWRTRRPEVPRP